MVGNRAEQPLWLGYRRDAGRRKWILSVINDVNDDTPVPPMPLRLIGEAAAMLRFYSRVPLPALGRFDDPGNPPPFARACRLLPIASIVIALPMAITTSLLGLTALPPLFIAVLAVGISLITTGALHEDGLADMTDGFGGGHTLARKLEIMKDSRIGSYGAAALVLAILGRVILIAGLIEQGSGIAAACLLAAAVVSRTLALGVFAALPSARADGVAANVGRPDSTALIVAGVLTIGLLICLAVPTIGLAHAFVGSLAASAISYAVARVALNQIGGQTGDIIGAAQVLSEIAFLSGSLAF